MTTLRPLPLLAALTLTLLAACATVAKVDAAGDVHAFLSAVRNNDKAAFEQHVDRVALKAQLESRILQMSRARKPSDGERLLTAVLAGPAARLASDTLVQPQVFRVAAEYFGYTPTTPIPNQLALAAALRYRPDGKVCAVAKKSGPCLFVFTDEAGVWKLTGFEGDLGDLKGVLR